MKPTKATGSPAARARSLHKRHPALSPTDIASKLGMPRQAVERALASTGKRGRPGAESRVVRLSAELLDRAEDAAEDEGIESREWIEDAIAVRLLRRRQQARR